MGDLLKCWLGEDLGFHFVFSSAVADFKVEDVPSSSSQFESQMGMPKIQHQLFQRTKGWVLCDSDGLCLVALREQAIYWYENRLLFSESDSSANEARLDRMEAMRRA